MFFFQLVSSTLEINLQFYAFFGQFFSVLFFISSLFVIFVFQFSPPFWFIVDQVTHYLSASFLLGVATFGAVGVQGIRKKA